LRLDLTGQTGVRTTSAIAASIAALLVTAAPAAALDYLPGWAFQRPAAQPATDARAKATKQPGQSIRRKHQQLIKEAGKDTEKLPPGPLHIIISIKKQQMTVYANGQAVAHSPVSTGVPGHPTPQGVFSILEKQIYHESNIYSSAPMPYMQRVTWSGVAMHQGVVPGHPASHGCIRLPAAFAQRLWRMTKVGARVIIAQDEVSLTDISSRRLFTALPQVISEAPASATVAKVRFATNEVVTDSPLKGSIDANESEEARIENAIDRAARAGFAEAAPEPVPANGPKAQHLFEKPFLLASVKDPALRPGPISVYISRKLGKLFVRKGFAEVFEAPVAIAQPNEPLGTHVFTALEARDDGTMRWNVASVPTERVVKQGKYLMTTTNRGEKLRKELAPPTHEVTPPGDPNAALDRITIPEDALARITELMTRGATLIISDLGMSYETGKGTDFIVLTR
jgi:lipoprotein-anchoring transpeptidase ErfK/SrfK